MDDGQHRAREGGHGLLEAAARGDVQVVDRLVEQEKVAALGHQAGQRQAGPLAKAETAHR